MKPTHIGKPLPPGWRWPTHNAEQGGALLQVRCEVQTCGRVVWNDTLYAVHRLPENVRWGARYACDGCLQRILELDIDADDAARRAGAPAAKTKQLKGQREAKEALEDKIHIRKRKRP
jgi:hypothetical protein